MATLVAWNFLNALGLAFFLCARVAELALLKREMVSTLQKVLIIFPAAILVNDLYIIPALSWFCRCRMCRRAGPGEIPLEIERGSILGSFRSASKHKQQ